MEIPEGWKRFGIASREEVEVRNKVGPLIVRYFLERGLGKENEIDVDAGSKLLLIELYVVIEDRHVADLKTIAQKNIPADYKCEVVYCNEG